MGFKNIIFFQNGSIGDFLMTLFFAENLHLADNALDIYIVIPRNKKLLSRLTIKYPYVKIIEANSKNFGFLKLLKFIFSANCVIVHPTPGKIPGRIKILAKIISLNPKSVMSGFKDAGALNGLYSVLLNYDPSVPYLETIKKTIGALGFPIQKEIPRLEYAKEEGVLPKFGLADNSYIFIHPFGSNPKRVIPTEDLKWLVEKILSDFGGLKIVISAGPGDKERVAELKNVFSENGSVVFLFNFSLNTLANLIDKSKLYIGVDTGITHLASFLGKKSLVVANNATANWLPYYNEKARVIYKIAGDESGVFEGKDYLRENLKGRTKCFDFVPKEVIFKCIKEELLENGK